MEDLAGSERRQVGRDDRESVAQSVGARAGRGLREPRVNASASITNSSKSSPVAARPVSRAWWVCAERLWIDLKAPWPSHHELGSLVQAKDLP
jgi:hypothetical protein